MTTPRYGSWSPLPGTVQTITPLDTKGPARLWNAPAGFVVRERGAVGAVSTNVYECPVHGQFEARSDADEVVCPVALSFAESVDRTEHAVDFRWASRPDHCGRPSPWRPSRFNVWQSAGEVKS